MTQSDHVLMVCWPAVGHARPMLDYAAALLNKNPDLTITFVCSKVQIALLQRLAISEHLNSERFGERLRLFGTGMPAKEVLEEFTNREDAKNATSSSGATDSSDDRPEPEVILTIQAATLVREKFAEIFPTILANQDLIDSEDSSVLLPACVAGSPSSIIVNWMLPGMVDIARKHSATLKMVTFFDNASTFVTRMLGPRSIGGFGGIDRLWNQYCNSNLEVDRDDGVLKEKLLGRRWSGGYQIPGSRMGSIEETEMATLAKDWLLSLPITPSLIEIQKLVDASHTVLINTHLAVEERELEYFRIVLPFKNIGIVGPVMFSGFVQKGEKLAARLQAEDNGQGETQSQPITPPRSPRMEEDSDSTDGKAQKVNDVENFLSSSPAGSIVYISFGTMFRPQPAQLVEKLQIFVDEMRINPDFRLLVTFDGSKDLVSSCPPAFAPKVLELESQLLASGNAMLTNWVDQHFVLQHPSVGWFFSHGGWNSCQEAMLAGKPLLILPFFGDQLFNAYLLESASVAFRFKTTAKMDLAEFVRNFEQGIACCRRTSEHGARLTREAKKLKDRLKEERSQGEVIFL